MPFAFGLRAATASLVHWLTEYVQKKKGLVSEAGLERLAQRIGLDCLVEDLNGPDGHKTKTLIIAGSNTQIDIALDNNIVKNVTLAFPGLSESTSKHMEAAGPLLLEDLCLQPNQSPLTKSLDKFAFNMERLASLDKLSVMPTFDCREALAGLYISLERLHKWDVAKLREDASMTDKTMEYLATQAMCTRHGQPVMHARGQVGLALQYWKEKRFSPPLSNRDAELDKIWSLAIGCVPTTADQFAAPRARVSQDWISNDVVAQQSDITGESGIPLLDWQEPESVTLPGPDANKDDSLGLSMLQPNLPQVMFSATINPPTILPQSDVMQLYQYADSAPPPLDYDNAQTFDNLFFPVGPEDKQDPSELRAISRRRQVRVFGRDRQAADKVHRNTLFIYKQIYASNVTEMPFSHPKQLIHMLPLLRQYAFISTLLHNSFGPKTEATKPPSAEARAVTVKKMREPTAQTTTTTEDELAVFMGAAAGSGNVKEERTRASTEAASASASDEVNMDVILWVHPAPHLQVVFPFRDTTVNITLQILPNGVVDIINENVLSSDGNGKEDETQQKKKKLTRADLGKVLEHLEDLCKWAEWIRTRLS
jgi:hypothetical protein